MDKPTEEQQKKLDEHFLRCHYDYPYFARTNHRIQDEDNELVPFILNDEQQVLEEIWADILKDNRLVRLFVLKGRKQGVSTWFASRGHWMITAKGKFKERDGKVYFDGLVKNQNMSVIAHDPKTTAYLFEMSKRLDAHVQPEIEQPKLKNNGYIIHFQNDTNTGLDSTIMVGSADTKDACSGMTLTISHRSELAKWPSENIKSLLTSLDNAMPAKRNTAVLNESTAKGLGGEFHSGFISCRYVYEVYQDENQNPHWKMHVNEDADPMNEYSSIFIPWFIARKYQMKVPEGFKRTLEEEKWVGKYNLSDEQLAWYRWSLPNRCGGDKGTRSQEYPMNAKEAFLASGTPSFDIPRVMHFKDLCRPPISRYDCLLSLGQFVAKADGMLKVWKEPKQGCSYLISADVSEGLEHGDFDSADVLDHMTGEQVAHFHGKMSPYEYAALLYHLGMRYNEAWLVPERNNHGISVIQELERLEYPNIYVEMIVEPPNKPRKRWGWQTSSKSRPLILDNLKQVMMDEDPGIRCAETFDEMGNFKRQKDGREEADSGTFDDRVMSIAIGKHCIKTLPCIVAPSRNQTGGAVGKGRSKKRPSNRAWQ